MKKILVLLGIFTVTPFFAYGYIDESETAAIGTLKRQGFSESALQLVDLSKYNNGGKSNKYVRYYTPKRSKLGRAYQNLKVYFDPVQDDGLFGEHDIEYSNTWLGRDTFYSSDLDSNKQLENL